MNQELEQSVQDLVTQLINAKDERIAVMDAELNDYRNKLSASYGMVDRAQLVAQEYMSKYENSQNNLPEIVEAAQEKWKQDREELERELKGKNLVIKAFRNNHDNLEKAAESDEKEIARLKAEIAELRNPAPTGQPTSELPKSEFKAGDRAYLKKELKIGRSMWSCQAGKECCVVKVDNNKIYVDFLVTSHWFLLEDAREYFTHTKPK